MQTRNENHAMQPVAVVLGAGAIACAIARRVAIGQHLLLADVKPENAEAAAQTLRAAGFACSTAQVNVAERASVQALAERAAALGSIRAVIHTAGLSPSQAAPQDILCIGSDNIGEDKWEPNSTWPNNSSLLSTATAATPRWCICQKSASPAIRTF